jgi:NitT/TauT family transport system permease protein
MSSDQSASLTSPTRTRERWLAGRVWPKLFAVAIALCAWQAIAASGIQPSYVLPGPWPVLRRVGEEIVSGQAPLAAAITLSRALIGFAIAVVAGTVIGLALTTSRVLRAGLQTLFAGLQTMPSVAWFPLAILLFQLSEAAIISVVVLGATPSIAVAVVTSSDQVPPLLLRAGRSLGATGWKSVRHVVLPAILPGFVGGLKQGWAFAWRSLMAGELLVIIGQRPALGVRLQYAREFSDAEGLMAFMLVILAIGVFVDGWVFGTIAERLNRTRGLLAS